MNPAGIVNGKDRRQLQGLWEEPDNAQLGYTVPNLLIEYVMRNTHVPVGPWRGVNTNQNGVYMECFMDEVAKAAGKDPLEFRRALMKDFPKHLAVLNAAAEKGDWGKPPPRSIRWTSHLSSGMPDVSDNAASDASRFCVGTQASALPAESFTVQFITSIVACARKGVE